MTTATGEFHVETWNETPYRQGDNGRKLTRATVRQTFSGDIEGEGVTEYLMAYKADGTADFTGLQTIEGKVGGKKGVLVLRVIGDFDGKCAKANAEVLSGACQGDFSALTGKGEFEAPMGDTGEYSLKYDLH